MSNREALTEAGILNKDVKLTPEQEKAIESLTAEDIETLKSISDLKKRLGDKFPVLTGLVVHHIN